MQIQEKVILELTKFFLSYDMKNNPNPRNKSSILLASILYSESQEKKQKGKKK